MASVMNFIWRMVFSTTMLVAAATFAGVAYMFYDDRSAVSIIFGVLSAVATVHAIRGPKQSTKSSSSGRRRRRVKYKDIDPDLYEKALDIPSNPNARPTRAQIKFARSIGIELPAHVTAGTAVEIIDDAIDM